MGRLVGLELHNFKSYRGTTSIGFGTSFFTSIIGPNGSGKSNIMDAISFVLGVRSSHLRSSHLNDLIYRGSVMANDEEEVDEESEDDSNPKNSPNKAYVMCIYERSNGDVLKLKRSIVRNRNSEYRVNNRVVSALEYANVLKRENVLIKARNFLVFQGDVEAIASQSATDLTNLIETISGSIEYKKEYDQLKEEQEAANEQTKSTFSTRRTLNAELRQYKEQCTEAELFQKKLADKADLIRLSKIYELYHFDQAIASLSDKLGKYKRKAKALSADLKNEEGAFKKVSSEYAKYELNANKLQKRITIKSKELEAKQRDLIPIETEKSFLLSKLNTYEDRAKELIREIQRQNSNIEDISNQLHIVVESKKAFELKLQQETSTQLSSEALAEYQKLRESFLMKGGAEEENVLNGLAHERDLIESQYENTESTKNATAENLRNFEYDLKDLNKQLSELTARLNNDLDALKSKKQELTGIKDAKKTFLDQEFTLNSKLKEVLIQINDLNANQRESNRERKLRENVATLKRLFPGVRGLVSDLCRPTQKKYELAVSTILGKNFDSIVVDNLSVASKCIEYLKEQRAGVATFIPLDSVNSNSPASYLRQVHQQAKPSIDCIEYPSYLERAIQYCCGNSMICDDMEVAKFIKWEKNIDVKVVTIEGSLIHKAGLMTGGKTKNEGRKFNKNELNSLQDLKLELMKKIDELKAQLPSDSAEKKLMNEIDTLEEELNQLRRTRVKLQRELDDKESHARIQREALAANNAKLEELKEQLSVKSSEIEDQESVIAALQNEVYKEFCDQNKLASINEYENTFKNSAKYKQKTAFLKQISILENKLTFEKERVAESELRLTKLDKEKSKLKEKMSVLENEHRGQTESLDLLESELDLLKEDLAKFDSKYHANFKDSSVSSTKLDDLKSELSIEKSKIDEVNEDLLKELNNKLQVLKTCKIENIAISLTNGSFDDIPIDIVAEDEEEEARLLHLAKTIQVDFEDLPEKYRESSDALSEELQSKITQLQEKLESLTPNSKALERLREVELKLSTIESEFKQRRQEEQKIVNRFNELKQKRYSRFNEAFEHISHNINDIYKELTKSPASPLGGSAYLTLEDEDEPYTAGIKYHAMPPMKRFTDMELLSGGEKTIAALALLFAIHSYHPSPFFVLDEVDAALDNSNVNKLANYIRNNCNENFQFIVISLKNSLFEKSDSLIGIYRNQDENSSRTVTLDLRGYPERA